ncbi:MAG: M48 family metallopeptidase, partial [Gammaproteobacteria bacterium]|nr:M48 family metallopeptidase [Gammaproteobacteria bacterium]
HDDVFNAFATLGGNVLFYRGLLDQMPHENALAMVVAHEISHVLHRDPISGLGGGMASSLALSVVLGNTGAAGDMLQTTGVLTGIQFTRKMETAADTRAVAAVNALYGHVNGADELFRAISVMRGGSDSSSEWLERFTSTHPLDEDRIRAVLELAERQGWDVEGELTPLPTDYETWLQ